jgi:hypothetical protein
VRAEAVQGGPQSGRCGQRVGGGPVGRGGSTGCDARSGSLQRMVRPWEDLHEIGEPPA